MEESITSFPKYQCELKKQATLKTKSSPHINNCLLMKESNERMYQLMMRIRGRTSASSSNVKWLLFCTLIWIASL